MKTYCCLLLATCLWLNCEALASDQQGSKRVLAEAKKKSNKAWLEHYSGDMYFREYIIKQTAKEEKEMVSWLFGQSGVPVYISEGENSRLEIVFFNNHYYVNYQKRLYDACSHFGSPRASLYFWETDEMLKFKTVDQFLTRDSSPLISDKPLT